jgi:transcriptional regulator with XRE-family HTH domain
MAYVGTAELNIMAITRNEREFFIELGSRIATLRKDAHITQVQLAQTLGVAQSTLNAYELGQRRVPVSALPILAKSLGVSLEELIGEKPAPGKRGPTPKLQQQMERINQLPKAKQKFVIEMLEGVLSQAGR